MNSEFLALLRARFIQLCGGTVFWWLLAAVLVLAGFHVMSLFDRSRRDEYEGAMMLVADRMDQGLPSPEWIAKIPYTVSPYGPGYFALCNVVSSVGPWHRSLIPGRSVSIVAGLLTAGLIGLVVGRGAKSAETGLASAAIYLAYPLTAFWIHAYRVDALAVLFAIAAYVASGLPRRQWHVSAVLVVVGSLVKPTVGFAAVPIVLHLLIERRRREAVLYTLGVLTLAGVLWGILCYESGGYYVDIGLRGNQREYSAARAIGHCRTFLRNPVTVIALLCVLASAVTNPVNVLRCRFSIAGAVALGLAAVGAGIEGGFTNYYLESAALASALLGLYGINSLWRISREWTSVLLCAASIATIVGIAGYTLKKFQSQAREPDLTCVLDYVKSPYILADRDYIALVASLGFVPAVNDPFFYRVAVRNRAIDAGKLAADMRAGRVGGLVLYRLREECSIAWPVEIVDVMKSHYVPAHLDSSKQIYIYKFGFE